MKTRAATKWRIQVLPSKDGKQWYIRFKRSGRIVLVGETHTGKRATIATAKRIAEDMRLEKAVFEDLTGLDELPNGAWEF